MLNQNNPPRCPWADLSKPDYVDYHDREWGVPVHDDRLWFEFLILEGAQAGLSWYTVLRKRENYRAALDDFDPKKIAGYDENRVKQLLENPGIIRNRLKVLSAVSNAQSFLEVQEEYGSFDVYIWRIVGGKPVINDIRGMSEIPATTPVSDTMSKELRQRGFKFVGSTICYAYMQATGMVNDHSMACFRRQEIIELYGGIDQ